MAIRDGVTVRGTTNRNARGSSAARRARRRFLVQAYRADVDVARIEAVPGGMIFAATPLGTGVPACRCYRCGRLLTEDTVSADRYPIAGCDGGTYKRDNIRPACEPCQSIVGGGTRRKKKGARRG